MYLIRFEPMVMSYFCVFRILAPYVDISGTNCNMNSHLSVIRALGVYGSIGTEHIKFHVELHFLFKSLCLYICMYAHFAGFSKSRYTYLVLIVDFNWLSL